MILHTRGSIGARMLLAQNNEVVKTKLDVMTGDTIKPMWQQPV